MFGLNKVTGRGRQTIDALKQAVDRKLGVLSNVQSDSKTFSFPTEDKLNFTHTHTFKLENSTGVLISCRCARYPYSYSLTITRGDRQLIGLEENEGLYFGCGFSIENGFIIPYYIAVPDQLLMEPSIYFPLTDGKGTLGDITVTVTYDGAVDSATFVSNITANFN